MTLHIAVLNHSSHVTDAQAAAMVRGVRAQLQKDFAPAWRMYPPEIRFYTDVVNAPNDSAIITLRETSHVQDALGDHDQDDSGRPRAEILIGPILDSGGGILDKDLSVSTVLSHEALELAADPYIVDWSQFGGVLYARESVDPVENDSYFIQTTRRGELVMVSNFVTPEWFTPYPPPHSYFDKLGKLDGPFTMTDGGYVITMMAGQIHIEYGANYPEWKKEFKKRHLGRTAIRVLKKGA